MTYPVRCSECMFARKDPKASDKHWDAIECGNIASDHYKELLNIKEDGAKLESVIWDGCALGEPKMNIADLRSPLSCAAQ